jgi:ATP-binding protein involved in chromosome partitioning
VHSELEQAALVEAIMERLAGVIDPELGQNVVELGMVGDVTVSSEGAARVSVALTTPSCPLREQIERDVRGAVESLEAISSIEIAIHAMDAEAKAALMDVARRFAQDDAPITSIPSAARVLGISSGKGGVGKSSVAANLSVALARRGLTVGLLDADIWGFSLPRLLGLDGPVEAHGGKMIPQRVKVGEGELRVLSMGFLAEEDAAIMWRGLLLSRALQQFIEDADWSGIDYLLIDLPPGTGDVQMALARLLPRTELLVVTTPPLAAQQVAARAADMARRGNLRIAGVIENMSDFTCEHGSSYALFGEGGGERLATKLGVPLVGRLPLDPAVVTGGDAGTPVAGGEGESSRRFAELAERVATDLAPTGELAGCSARMLDAIEAAVAGAER